MSKKQRRLGRGLEALLGVVGDEDGDAFDDAAGEFAPEAPPATKTSAASAAPASPPYRQEPEPSDSAVGIARAAEVGDASPQVGGPNAGGEWQLAIDLIDKNPFQPRRDFSPAELNSLAESLKEHRMLQPVLVRRRGERYQLISGERRWRAAQLAGWTTLPARLFEADDRLAAELAIVENLQRKDLNPLEKALSFKRYLDEHRCPQEDLARRLKLDRSTIANLMRLLELPDEVQEAIRDGSVTAGHARALLPLGDEDEQIAFCRRVQSDGLSVREVERQVQAIVAADNPAAPAGGKAAGPAKRVKPEQVASLEQEFRAALGSRVEIKQTAKGRGKIIIHFGDHDEFERLRDLFSLEDEPAGRRVG